MIRSLTCCHKKKNSNKSYLVIRYSRSAISTLTSTQRYAIVIWKMRLESVENQVLLLPVVLLLLGVHHLYAYFSSGVMGAESLVLIVSSFALFWTSRKHLNRRSLSLSIILAGGGSVLIGVLAFVTGSLKGLPVDEITSFSWMIIGLSICLAGALLRFL